MVRACLHESHWAMTLGESLKLRVSQFDPTLGLREDSFGLQNPNTFDA